MLIFFALPCLFSFVCLHFDAFPAHKCQRSPSKKLSLLSQLALPYRLSSRSPSPRSPSPRSPSPRIPFPRSPSPRARERVKPASPTDDNGWEGSSDAGSDPTSDPTSDLTDVSSDIIDTNSDPPSPSVLADREKGTLGDVGTEDGGRRWGPLCVVLPSMSPLVDSAL